MPCLVTCPMEEAACHPARRVPTTIIHQESVPLCLALAQLAKMPQSVYQPANSMAVMIQEGVLILRIV